MADQTTVVNVKDTPPLPLGAHGAGGSTAPQPSDKDASSNSDKNDRSTNRVFSSKVSKEESSGTVGSTSPKSLPRSTREGGRKKSGDSLMHKAGNERGTKHSGGRNRWNYYYNDPRQYGGSCSHGNDDSHDDKAQLNQQRDKRAKYNPGPNRDSLKSHHRPSQGQSGTRSTEISDRTGHKDDTKSKERVGEGIEQSKLTHEKNKSNSGPRRGHQKSYHKIPQDQGSARSDDDRINRKDRTRNEEKLDDLSNERPGQGTGDDDGTQGSRSDNRSHQGRGRNYGRKHKDFKDPRYTLSLPHSQRSVPLVGQNSPDKNGSISDKTDLINMTTKSSDSIPREDMSETLAKDSQPVENPSSSHSRETKRTDYTNYTKRKHEKPSQQSRFKSRQKGQKSTHTVQSDQLGQELTAGTYECMVCCERVRGRDQVWSCEGCYHVFHLKCINKWASAPTLGTEEGAPEGWKCPSCRKTSVIIPTVYRCFCGRVVNPRQRGRGELTVPHTCGDTCLKSLAVGLQSSCRHKCRLPCHPGPCPPCPVMVTRTCPCGKKSHQVRCSRTGDLPSCGGVCGHGLACGRHTCEESCHSGACPACEKVLTQQCHCSREMRQSCCSEEKSLVFSCGQICKKELDCGNHLCELLCHEGPCPSCSLLPSAVTTCPCGATPLSRLLSEGEERISCFDPIPTCDQVCGKILTCSTNSDDPHCCLAVCHLGACPQCDRTSSIRCVCGSSTMSIPCVEVVGRKGVELKCGRVCNKKKSCGRHRCNARCCVDMEHKCELLCGKKLQCGLHYCKENCHRGHCEQCWEYSYNELTCHCGAAVIHPPIPCGTRPPFCARPCARMHPCGHPITHPCHNDQICPPCTFLTEKMCMGGHELRCNIPCHLTDISCGVACGRPLPCNMHKCQRTCHRGNCDELPCQQPCTNKRKLCDHPCGEPCHTGRACPDTPCQALVDLKCECGRRKEKMVCMASESKAMKQAFQMFSKELGSSGETINISAITSTNRSRLKSLECDEVCRQLRRNRELAAALNIEHPIINPLESGSSGETVQYSLYLLEEARLNLEFVAEVEEALKTLVETATKGPLSKTHKHLFRPMKSNQRRIIHELSVYYGCETTSFDQEPMRNVAVYTTKSQVKLPSVSLTKLIERERYKPPPAPLHVMTVSEKTEPTAAKKFARLKEPDTVPDYFADDFKL